MWAWEEELVMECRDLLHTVSLQVDLEDKWLWVLTMADGYTIRGA